MKFLDALAGIVAESSPGGFFDARGGVGLEKAEAVVFYFGKGQGGSVEANIDRWASQFAGKNGSKVAPRVSTEKIGGLKATKVELSGNYARGVGVGPQGEALPGRALSVWVVETPEGNVTFQLHGPETAVKRESKAFDAFARSVK